jgi:AhpD family alkylhydroperoxidase
VNAGDSARPTTPSGPSASAAADGSGGPRVAPGTRRQLGPLGWGISRGAGLLTRTQPPHLFLTLGRHRSLFRGWLVFASRLMPRGRLPRRETELVILRVAHLRECRYEFDHHVRLARRAGVGPKDIARVVAGPDAPGWSPRERVLLHTVDALHERQDLNDREWSNLSHHLDDREAIELCLLIGHYEMLATTIAVLRIQPDD